MRDPRDRFCDWKPPSIVMAAMANCGLPVGQYDVAPVDWRRRTFKTLEVALNWLADFLGPAGVLVVWVPPKRPRPTKPLASPWKSADLSSRPERSMNAAVPFRRGDAK